MHVAHSLVNKILKDYLVKYQLSVISEATIANGPSTALPELNEYIKQYQDPLQSETIMEEVEQEQRDKQIPLQNCIPSVCPHGESLGDMDKSSSLLSEAASRSRYRRPETNSWCVIC